MPKILGFKAEIKKVRYSKVENKSAFTKDEQPILFYCNVTLKELGRGLAKSNITHNASLQITEEDFDNKQIEVGDHIEILDNATWHPDNKVDYVTYDSKKLENYDKSLLKVDEKGRTFAKTTIFPYSLRCKLNQWKMDTKYYDLNYCTIINSGVRLPLESREKFKDTKLDYFLDKNEMDIIGKWSGQKVKVIAYSNKNKVDEKEMTLFTKIEEESKSYYMLLSEE